MPVALITGLSGFTGKYLAVELRAAGYSVAGLVFGEPGNCSEQTYACDLCDIKALSAVIETVKPDVVVHLAGISFVAHGNVDEIYRTNVVGTRNLLQAIHDVGHLPRIVLLASSANVYGNAAVEVIDELVPPAPANDYAVSKLAMEYMARLWFDRLPITIVRPFNYTGVGQSEAFLLPKIVNHFRRRAHEIELGNLDVFRDFSDVRFVAQCYRALLESEGQGQIFNICSGVGTSLQEVLHMMHDISGYSPEVRVNPAFVRVDDVRRLLGSRFKLEQVIGRVAAIPLEDTLRWMYAAPQL